MLSSITLLGNAGWNHYFHSSFLPSWLFPAVLFIFVKFSFMPSICHLSTGSVSFAVFTAVQSYGWPFICLIFILDAYTKHWSMQFWILYMSSRFSFILLWRYLSFGQLWKAAFLRLSLLTFPTVLQFSTVHIAGCQLNCCKSIFSFSIL